MKRKRPPGEGSIYLRKDGRYAAAKTVGYTPAGNPRRVTAYGRTQAEARARLEARISELGGPAMLPMLSESSSITVGEWLDSWVAYKKNVSNLKPGSIDRYKNVIKVHLKPELGARRLATVRPAHVEHLLGTIAAKGRSARTIRYIWQTLNAACKHAVRRGLIAANPCAAVEKPRPEGAHQKPPQVWAREQALLFLAAAQSSHYYPLYHLALTTGMRRGELIALDAARDVDLVVGCVSIRETQSLTGEVTAAKTERSRRTIPLPSDTVEVLTEWEQRRPTTTRFFVSPEGHRISARNLFRDFKDVVEKSSAPEITFHGMRHTYATLALRAGVPLVVVSERLGHASPETTMRIYAHVLADMKQAGALTIAELTVEAERKEAVN